MDWTSQHFTRARTSHHNPEGTAKVLDRPARWTIRRTAQSQRIVPSVNAHRDTMSEGVRAVCKSNSVKCPRTWGVSLEEPLPLHTFANNTWREHEYAPEELWELWHAVPRGYVPATWRQTPCNYVKDTWRRLRLLPPAVPPLPVIKTPFTDLTSLSSALTCTLRMSWVHTVVENTW